MRILSAVAQGRRAVRHVRETNNSGGPGAAVRHPAVDHGAPLLGRMECLLGRWRGAKGESRRQRLLSCLVEHKQGGAAVATTDWTETCTRQTTTPAGDSWAPPTRRPMAHLVAAAAQAPGEDIGHSGGELRCASRRWAHWHQAPHGWEPFSPPPFRVMAARPSWSSVLGPDL